MKTFELSFRLSSTDPGSGIGFELLCDGNQLLDRPAVTRTESIRVTITDDHVSGTVRSIDFVLKNKTEQHTQIDDQGRIIRDVLLRVDEIKIDDIGVDNIWTHLSVYHHDFNGNGDAVAGRFAHDMGCNGSVRLEFTSPVHLWLLNNW